MKAFRRETGVAAPLPRANVDTDQIIPKQFLKRIERTGFGEFLFNDWRYAPDGGERADFVLNQDPYRQARFLIAGRNFGSGSSREHAVWALDQFGIRAVIAPSFADIFYSNATKDGLVPVVLPEGAVLSLQSLADQAPGTEATVDLESMTVHMGDLRYEFSLDPFTRHCIMEGLDDIGLTLQQERAITRFEESRPSWMPTLTRANA